MKLKGAKLEGVKLKGREVTSVSRVRKSKHLLFTFLERDVTTPNEPSVARLGFCLMREGRYAERK